MTKPDVLRPEARGINFRVFRWPAVNENSNAPVKTALLTHGTGLVAASWWLVAPVLAQAGYTVYAIDRRGHGGSDAINTAPEDIKTGNNEEGNGYEFLDFAEDIIAIVDTLNLKNIYAIGHSAGGTDLLLAATLHTTIFERIFVIDPTLGQPAETKAQLPEEPLNTLKRMTKKRASYDNVDAFKDRALSRPPFSLFQPTALDAHLEYAFNHHSDGSIHLCCEPATEIKIMRRIYEAMYDCYQGDKRGEPFHRLADITTPTAIGSSGQSMPIYQKMVEVGLSTIPNVKHFNFPNQNHCVPMEAPELTAQTILQFTKS